MHPQRIALRGLSGGDRVVQVLGVGAVDGENGLLPQVQAVGKVLLCHGHLADLLGLGQHLRGKLGGNAAALNDGVGTNPGPVAAAKYHLHRCLPPVAAAILPGLKQHLVPVLGAAQQRLGHLQVVADGPIRGDPGPMLVHMDRAGDFILAPLYNALNPAAGAPVPLLQAAKDDGIPYKGPVQVPAGDKNILPRLGGPGKAKALGNGHQSGLNLRNRRGQLDPMVLVHQHLAGLF